MSEQTVLFTVQDGSEAQEYAVVEENWSQQRYDEFFNQLTKQRSFESLSDIVLDFNLVNHLAKAVVKNVDENINAVFEKSAQGFSRADSMTTASGEQKLGIVEEIFISQTMVLYIHHLKQLPHEKWPGTLNMLKQHFNAYVSDDIDSSSPPSIDVLLSGLNSLLNDSNELGLSEEVYDSVLDVFLKLVFALPFTSSFIEFFCSNIDSHKLKLSAESQQNIQNMFNRKFKGQQKAENYIELSETSLTKFPFNHLRDRSKTDGFSILTHYDTCVGDFNYLYMVGPHDITTFYHGYDRSSLTLPVATTDVSEIVKMGGTDKMSAATIGDKLVVCVSSGAVYFFEKDTLAFVKESKIIIGENSAVQVAQSHDNGHLNFVVYEKSDFNGQQSSAATVTVMDVRGPEPVVINRMAVTLDPIVNYKKAHFFFDSVDRLTLCHRANNSVLYTSYLLRKELSNTDQKSTDRRNVPTTSADYVDAYISGHHQFCELFASNITDIKPTDFDKRKFLDEFKPLDESIPALGMMCYYMTVANGLGYNLPSMYATFMMDCTLLGEEITADGEIKSGVTSIFSNTFDSFSNVEEAILTLMYSQIQGDSISSTLLSRLDNKYIKGTGMDSPGQIAKVHTRTGKHLRSYEKLINFMLKMSEDSSLSIKRKLRFFVVFNELFISNCINLGSLFNEHEIKTLLPKLQKWCKTFVTLCLNELSNDRMAIEINSILFNACRLISLCCSYQFFPNTFFIDIFNFISEYKELLVGEHSYYTKSVLYNAIIINCTSTFENYIGDILGGFTNIIDLNMNNKRPSDYFSLRLINSFFQNIIFNINTDDAMRLLCKNAYYYMKSIRSYMESCEFDREKCSVFASAIEAQSFYYSHIVSILNAGSKVWCQGFIEETMAFIKTFEPLNIIAGNSVHSSLASRSVEYLQGFIMTTKEKMVYNTTDTNLIKVLKVNEKKVTIVSCDVVKFRFGKIPSELIDEMKAKKFWCFVSLGDEERLEIEGEKFIDILEHQRTMSFTVPKRTTNADVYFEIIPKEDEYELEFEINSTVIECVIECYTRVHEKSNKKKVEIAPLSYNNTSVDLEMQCSKFKSEDILSQSFWAFLLSFMALVSDNNDINPEYEPLSTLWLYQKSFDTADIDELQFTLLVDYVIDNIKFCPSIYAECTYAEIERICIAFTIVLSCFDRYPEQVGKLSDVIEMKCSEFESSKEVAEAEEEKVKALQLNEEEEALINEDFQFDEPDEDMMMAINMVLGEFPPSSDYYKETAAQLEIINNNRVKSERISELKKKKALYEAFISDKAQSKNNTRFMSSGKMHIFSLITLFDESSLSKSLINASLKSLLDLLAQPESGFRKLYMPHGNASDEHKIRFSQITGTPSFLDYASDDRVRTELSTLEIVMMPMYALIGRWTHDEDAFFDFVRETSIEEFENIFVSLMVYLYLYLPSDRFKFIKKGLNLCFKLANKWDDEAIRTKYQNSANLLSLTFISGYLPDLYPYLVHARNHMNLFTFVPVTNVKRIVKFNTYDAMNRKFHRIQNHYIIHKMLNEEMIGKVFGENNISLLLKLFFSYEKIDDINFANLGALLCVLTHLRNDKPFNIPLENFIEKIINPLRPIINSFEFTPDLFKENFYGERMSKVNDFFIFFTFAMQYMKLVKAMGSFEVNKMACQAIKNIADQAIMQIPFINISGEKQRMLEFLMVAYPSLTVNASDITIETSESTEMFGSLFGGGEDGENPRLSLYSKDAFFHQLPTVAPTLSIIDGVNLIGSGIVTNDMTFSKNGNKKFSKMMSFDISQECLDGIRKAPKETREYFEYVFNIIERKNFYRSSIKDEKDSNSFLFEPAGFSSQVASRINFDPGEIINVEFMSSHFSELMPEGVTLDLATMMSLTLLMTDLCQSVLEFTRSEHLPLHTCDIMGMFSSMAEASHLTFKEFVDDGVMLSDFIASVFEYDRIEMPSIKKAYENFPAPVEKGQEHMLSTALQNVTGSYAIVESAPTPDELSKGQEVMTLTRNGQKQTILQLDTRNMAAEQLSDRKLITMVPDTVRFDPYFQALNQVHECMS
ncbi:hypothetical protein PCE1_000986 [Barthelona sp. PCE]